MKHVTGETGIGSQSGGQELINDTAAYHQEQSRSRSPSLAKWHIYFSDLCSHSPSCFRGGFAAGPRFGRLQPRSCHIHLLHALSHRCTPVVDSPMQSELANISQHQRSGHRGWASSQDNNSTLYLLSEICQIKEDYLFDIIKKWFLSLRLSLSLQTPVGLKENILKWKWQ